MRGTAAAPRRKHLVFSIEESFVVVVVVAVVVVFTLTRRHNIVRGHLWYESIYGQDVQPFTPVRDPLGDTSK